MSNMRLILLATIVAALALPCAHIARAATKAGEIRIDSTGRQFLAQMQSDQKLAKCTFDNARAMFTCVDLIPAGADFLYQGAVDINGNNVSDLALLNVSQGDRGDATIWPDFVRAQAITPRQVRTLWRVDTVGDMDGDAVGDLVWRFTGQTPNLDDTGVSYVWFMNRDGTVNQVRKRGGAPLTWSLLGSSDVNGDGAADMVYVSPANAVRVLMATPNRTCANLSAGSIDASYTPLYLAEFSFVGVPDILARNPATGVVRLTTINAAGITLPAYTGAPDDANASCSSTTQTIPQVLSRDIQSDTTWQVYATGDFNNDGLIDILWKKPDGNLAMWLMSPNGGAPLVNTNVGTAPPGYVGLSQSGTRTNSADTVTYAIASADAYVSLVTKTGITRVANKTTAAVSPSDCWIAHIRLTDGKILAKCQDGVTNGGRVFYIDSSNNELRDYTGFVPSGITWLFITLPSTDKPEWGARARVADGWYFTSSNAPRVLKFQNDAGLISTVLEGDASFRVLRSFPK